MELSYFLFFIAIVSAIILITAYLLQTIQENKRLRRMIRNLDDEIDCEKTRFVKTTEIYADKIEKLNKENSKILDDLEKFKKNPSADLQQFIADLTSGSALIKIEPISTDNLFIYRNKR